MIPKGLLYKNYANKIFKTNLIDIIPKKFIYLLNNIVNFETSLFDMIQKVENQKIYMFK